MPLPVPTPAPSTNQLFVFVISIINFLLALLGVISPPGPPQFNYVSPTLTVQEVGDCADGSRVWVYTPDFMKSNTEHDVVVYLHGFSAAFPFIYQQHIDHIVKQGRTVLFPQFQEGYCFDQFSLEGLNLLGQSPAAWAERAVSSVTDVLENVVVDYDNVYLYGHSLGGAIGLIWSSLSDQQGLDIVAGVFASPQPGGFAAIPGNISTTFPFFFGEDIDVAAAAPLTKFPVAILHGNDDTIAPLIDVMPSYSVLGSTQKAIYQAVSDNHGEPKIVADHLAPTSISFLGSADVNTLDWRYYWSAVDQVMKGVAVTNLQFDLGQWTDGTSVQSIVLVDKRKV